MKIKVTLLKAACALLFALSFKGLAQAPVANFSISPNPVCAGAVVQITDLSTNSPTSWSYTLSTGPGPAGTVTSSIQNPTVTYNNNPITRTITLIATNASGASTPVTHTVLVIQAPTGNITPNTVSTCTNGNPVTLSVTTGTANTFIWSTGATTASITVSPSVTTSYSVVLTNSAGCTATRVALINVTTPSISINGNPSTLCGGSSAVLGIVPAQGQGGGPYTYAWSNSLTTRTISTNQAGVYTATATNNNGCSAIQSYTLVTSTSITVTATSNQTQVCSGSNANLIAGGANTYTWSNGTTTQQNMVTPTSNSTYTVIGASGTCTASAVISISVTPGPTLVVTATPTMLCSGGSATLSVSGATTYMWNNGSTNSVIAVTPTANTTYTVRGLVQGCAPRTSTILIHAGTPPNILIHATSATICAGTQAFLTAGGASSYTWADGPTTSVHSDTPAITTTYTVTGSSVSGCTNTATFVENVITCTGIKSVSAANNAVSIYPNPSNGSFMLSTPTAIYLSIINEMGQIVKTIQLTDSNNHQASVTGLTKGIYFIVGQNENSTVKQKIIVNN